VLAEGKNSKNIFKAVFIIGSPGAGKTEFHNAALAGQGLKHLDPDKILSFYVKKNKGSLKDTSNYNKYQSKIKKTLEGQTKGYLNGRLGLVIDGTGRDKSLIIKLKNKLEDLGYSTMMVYINTSIVQIMKRAKSRERAVDKDYLLKAKESVKKNVPDYKNMFGNNFIEINDMSEYQKGTKKVNAFLNAPLTSKAKKWMNEEIIFHDFINELLVVKIT